MTSLHPMTPFYDLTDLLEAAGDAGYDWDLRGDTIRWFGMWQKIFAAATGPQDSQALFRLLHADDLQEHS